MIDAHRTALLVRARLPGWVPDALAAVLAVGVLEAVSAQIRNVPGQPLDALGYALVAAAGVSMGLCRRWPKVALGVVTVVLAIFVARRYPDGPVWATGWIALAALSWRTSRQVAITGAGDIARLAESTTASGLAVALSEEGPAQAVPGVIGTAAYRVVQESLTNVLRHSRATAARVRLVSGPDGSVLLEIGDDGPGMPRASAGTGVGIRGMRERVVSTGGKFQAGPAAGGGFLVRAEWAARP